MADLYRELTAILREHGKGSHEIWYSPAVDRHVSVPRTTKSRHTANDVLKKAGIPKAL